MYAALMWLMGLARTNVLSRHTGLLRLVPCGMRHMEKMSQFFKRVKVRVTWVLCLGRGSCQRTALGFARFPQKMQLEDSTGAEMATRNFFPLNQYNCNSFASSRVWRPLARLLDGSEHAQVEDAPDSGRTCYYSITRHHIKS